jgi:hypothetical protein
MRPIMMLASVRRILTIMISFVVIVDDNEMTSCRVVSSCRWRRGMVGNAIAVSEEWGWEERRKAVTGLEA